MQKSILVSLVLGSFVNIISQENRIGSIPLSAIQTPDRFVIPDSLSSKDYRYLSKMFYRTIDSIEEARIYALSYLIKARESGENEVELKGYYLLSRISNDSLKINYLDHIIRNSLDKNYKREPTRSYLSKGDYFFDKRKFKLASENYLQASKAAEKRENKFYKYKSRFNVGLLKSRLGKYQEASKIFNEYYNYYNERLKSEEEHPKLTKSYLIALYAKSDTYTRLKRIDSASILNTMGANISNRSKQLDMANYFALLEGVNQYFKENYHTSIDSISKTLTFFKEYNDKSNLLYANLFLGKSYEKLQDINNTIKYYKTVDDLFSRNLDFAPEIKDSYSYLIKYYKSSKDYKNQLKYLEKMILVDSLLNDSYKYINNNIISKYDTPELLSQKNQLIQRLDESRKLSYPIILILTSALIITSLILFINNKKKRLYQKRFEALLDNTKKEIPKESVKSIKRNDISDIPDETIKRIKKGLNEFENKQSYLDKSITLNSLSKMMETNSNYLSRLINYLKNKKITDYVNDLRIDYTIDKLKSDKKFREYKIKAIADGVGFSNPVSFSQAFYKKTGIKPSFFIRELNKT